MRKKLTFIIPTLTLFSAICVGASILAVKYGSGSRQVVSATNCEHHHVNHYNRVEPTVDTSGVAEYWVCCECHTSFQDENLTTSFLNTSGSPSDPTDGRYLAPLSETVTITVVNGTGSGTYYIGSSATITATVPDDKDFDYWSVNSAKVSEDNPYTFIVSESATYTAVFKDKLDPDEVLSKILVVSDVHISSDQNTQNRLKNTLNYAVNSEIDAIIFDGDTANIATDEVYGLVDDVFTEVYHTPKAQGLPELIFNMGNHEFYPTDNCAHEETVYDREVGKFKTFAEKWGATIEDNVFTRTINGIECVLAFPSADRRDGDVYYAAGGAFSDNDVNKVKQKFDDILSTGYDKSIVFCTHQPLGKTYGSIQYPMDATSRAAFNSLLEDYPMVVHLAGHTHFSNLHERSIFQDDFTSIQIGTHTYGKYVSGVDYDEYDELLTYDNITSKRYNNYDTAAQSLHGSTNYGMLLTFTRSNMVADRINLSAGQPYAHGSWTVPYVITTENKDSKFTYKANDRVGETLTFAQNSEISFSKVGNKLTQLTFEDVEQYWACEGYEISIKDGSGNVIKRVLWASLFWAGLTQKQTYTIPFSNLGNPAIGSGYTASIRAINFFGHYSNPIVKDLEGEGDPYNRGDVFESGINYNKDLTPIPFSAGSMHVDVKFTSASDTYINIMIGNGWENWLGYYTVYARGILGENYNGVTLYSLEDGYYRIMFNFAQMDKLGGGSFENITQINLVYIRGNWSNASGYVDINSDVDVNVIRGAQFTDSAGFTKDISAVQLTETYVMDIRFTSSSDTYLNVMLGDGWSNYFGYYQVNANGTLGGTYAGVSINTLPDGYFRVTFVLSQLNKVGGGSIENITKINLIYIRNAYTTGSGYIDLNPSI